MRSEVGEWLATCVGSPICILLLSWSLLIYQNQPSSSKRRIDILTVAILSESLVHQLGLLFYAILTLIRPVNHFGEFCSCLVWLLNSSSILQELTLTSIAIFAAIISKDENVNLTKNHLKYHLVSLSVISGCVGMTGVLNFEPKVCVFLAHEISPKYGILVNSLRALLIITSFLSIFATIFVSNCCADATPTKSNELLKSISDLSETSSKNSSGAFECHPHNWDPSNGSYSSGSTNSRACLRKRNSRVDESSGRATVYSILFVCYIFDHLPLLIISMRPDLLKNFCTSQNMATWLPLIKDTLLPISLALFDKMFCRYVAKVYTKQNHSTKLSHGGIDGKFRHFEQDTEYKLHLNLNHGLKFPLTNGSLYGRLHSHQNRAITRTSTITMGVQQQQQQYYSRPASLNEVDDNNTYTSVAPEMLTTSFGNSNFDPRISDHHHTRKLRQNNDNHEEHNYEVASQRKIGRSIDVFGQNMENLVQFDAMPYCIANKRNFARSLDEIREEMPQRNKSRDVLELTEDFASIANFGNLGNSKARLQFNAIKAEKMDLGRKLVRRNQSFDLHARKYYNPPRLYEANNISQHGTFFKKEQETNYESSDDESCDFENNDFDSMSSSCRSRSRSCCSVTTVANDDFDFFQRKGTKVELLPSKRMNVDNRVNMRSFTPKIIEVVDGECNRINEKLDEKSMTHTYLLKKRMSPEYSMNDLDRFNNNNKQSTLSLESLHSILKNSGVSYLDNGEICRHNIAGSAPDFKKIFVTEFL